MYENMLLAIELLISGIHGQMAIAIAKLPADCVNCCTMNMFKKHMSVKLESETAK